jgi:hypothetical protein
MQLILHTGLHKTGSTSIQTFLNNQKLYNLHNFILYPDHGLTNGAHHDFANAILNNNSEVCENIVDHAIEDGCAGNKKIIIFSSEDFEYITSDGYLFLRKIFASRGIKPTIFTYIRPQIDLIVSQYSQQVREGAIRIDFEEFFDNCIIHGEFCKLPKILNNQLSLSGKINCRSFYNYDFTKKNILLDFIYNLNLPHPVSYTNVESYFINKSLTASKLSVVLKLLQRDDLFNSKREDKIYIIEKIIDMPEWNLMKSDYNITPSDYMYRKCFEVFFNDNEWMDRTFKIRFNYNTYHRSKIVSNELSLCNYSYINIPNIIQNKASDIVNNFLKFNFYGNN